MIPGDSFIHPNPIERNSSYSPSVTFFTHPNSEHFIHIEAFLFLYNVCTVIMAESIIFNEDGDFEYDEKDDDDEDCDSKSQGTLETGDGCPTILMTHV